MQIGVQKSCDNDVSIVKFPYAAITNFGSSTFTCRKSSTITIFYIIIILQVLIINNNYGRGAHWFLFLLFLFLLLLLSILIYFYSYSFSYSHVYDDVVIKKYTNVVHPFFYYYYLCLSLLRSTSCR